MGSEVDCWRQEATWWVVRDPKRAKADERSKQKWLRWCFIWWPVQLCDEWSHQARDPSIRNEKEQRAAKAVERSPRLLVVIHPSRAKGESGNEVPFAIRGGSSQSVGTPRQRKRRKQRANRSVRRASEAGDPNEDGSGEWSAERSGVLGAPGVSQQRHAVQAIVHVQSVQARNPESELVRRRRHFLHERNLDSLQRSTNRAQKQRNWF